MATSNKKSKVVFSKTYFPVEMVVFEHRNGDSRPSYTVKLTRSFRRDEESDWESTDYLSPQDLLPAGKLLGEAYSFIQAKLQKAYEEQRHQSNAAETAVEEVAF